MAKDLLGRMDQPFVACGAGRGAEDAVGRQATSAGAATTEGEAASVLVDVRKFFDKFMRDVWRAFPQTSQVEEGEFLAAMRARGVCQGFGDSGAVVDECWAAPVRCVSVHSLQGWSCTSLTSPSLRTRQLRPPGGRGRLGAVLWLTRLPTVGGPCTSWRWPEPP